MPDERPNAALVYRSLAAAVLGYLRAQRVPEPEDVVGDVFLQVARDLPRFRGDEAALRSWVFSIAHNRAMDAHRRRARRPSLADSGQLGGGRETPAPAPADPIDPALVEALSSLSADQREVVVLRFVADLPLEAVAKVTGRKVGAVKALQHRALDNLRRALPPVG
ncbi:MAG: sigma-70 family RNA polymerase sigma factor [Actinobacteria bacterium]|nr:sigma-70 family RNA polymerase sigma factor [Actinomycetota bacterium]MBW3651401.1 sigma-70 family RNA polymerase sigma factor [Actinomycetota bacterium]